MLRDFRENYLDYKKQPLNNYETSLVLLQCVKVIVGIYVIDIPKK